MLHFFSFLLGRIYSYDAIKETSKLAHRFSLFEMTFRFCLDLVKLQSVGCAYIPICTTIWPNFEQWERRKYLKNHNDVLIRDSHPAKLDRLEGYIIELALSL